jgi:hypothetical protein
MRRLLRPGSAACPDGTPPSSVGCGKPVSAKAIGALPGAAGQAAPGPRCYQVVDGTLSRLFDWRVALVVVKPDTSSAGTAKDSGSSGAGSRSRRDDRPASTLRSAEEIVIG